MICFHGYGDDPALLRAVAAAERAGVRHVVVDQQQLAGVQFELADDGAHGQLRLPGQRLALTDVTGCYARPLAPLPSSDAATATREADLAQRMVAWLDAAPIPVLNRPRAMHSNGSKPYQAQLIATAGFAVPRTLVTTDPDAVRAFVAEVGPVVFKSVSGVRSVVRVLDDAAAERLDRVRRLPTQFQARVPGVDVRVHVVGTRCFATRIISPAVDYRYAERDGLTADLTPLDLPDDLAERCVRLTATLGLSLAGIDLKLTPDGEAVCLEANPMPGYSYFEAHTGQPISTAIVDHLVHAPAPTAAVWVGCRAHPMQEGR